jgi:glycogen debranching enzyme
MNYKKFNKLYKDGYFKINNIKTLKELKEHEEQEKQYQAQKEKTICKFEIKEANGEKFIDILDNDYNIIKSTIYNQETAEKVMEIIKKEL